MQIYDKEYKIAQYVDTIDFVFDASTAEHIFEISCVSQNVSEKMLSTYTNLEYVGNWHHGIWRNFAVLRSSAPLGNVPS